MEREKICPVCEDAFYAQYRNKKYCSEACKQKMYRLRRLNENENKIFNGVKKSKNKNRETIEFSVEQIAKFAIEISKSWATQIMEFNDNGKYDIFNMYYIDARISEVKKILSKKYFPNSGILFRFFNFVGRVLKNLDDNSDRANENGEIEISFVKKSFKPCKYVLEIEY